MKEQLELKHLAPYLPYNTRAIDNFGKIKYIRGVLLNSFNALFVRLNDKDYCLNINSGIKPILRPLSDLTKEIEHNGEKFVPIEEWSWGRFEEISTLKNSTLRFIQLREYEILIEYHFDVSGLIDKGLAIDINTLK